MKVLLLLEHTFLIDEDNKVWSETVINYEYLKRYLDVFENVAVCARMKNVKNDDELLNKYNLLVSGNGVEFLPLPFSISSKEIIFSFFKTKRIFKKYLKNVDCAIIRGPSLLSLMLYKQCINNLKFAVEFVMGANTILSEKNFIRKILNKYLDRSAKKMCLKANGVSYVTKELLQKKYPSYKRKKNYISEDYFENYYSSIDLYKENFERKKWEKSKKPKEYIITHIGSMATDRKGQKRLIEIAKKILDDSYNIKVKFIGEGKQKQDLINYVKELNLESKVEFLGNINDRELLFSILKDSHFYVLPSSSEGLPRSIIEAMATSNPCIASNVDGIPELLDKKDIFDYYDVEGFVKRIEYLIENWEEMINISNNNYEIAQNYRYETLNKRRNEFYNCLKTISQK